jgi:hypothetical protein
MNCWIVSYFGGEDMSGTGRNKGAIAGIFLLLLAVVIVLWGGLSLLARRPLGARTVQGWVAKISPTPPPERPANAPLLQVPMVPAPVEAPTVVAVPLGNAELANLRADLAQLRTEVDSQRRELDEKSRQIIDANARASNASSKVKELEGKLAAMKNLPTQQAERTTTKRRAPRRTSGTKLNEASLPLARKP